MALQVTGSFDTPIGTTLPTQYWRWVSLSIDVTRSAATVLLYAYVDEGAFSDGKLPVDQMSVDLQGADFLAMAEQLEGAGTGLSNTIYDYCKANLPAFSADV